jgi:hypothetical protein
MSNNANTSLPANSPLRSAPLIEGKIYKDTDTNKCIGRFAGIKHSFRALANNSGTGVPYYEYHFNHYNYETGTFNEKSGSRFGTREQDAVIKHNLVEVREGECGRDEPLVLPEAANNFGSTEEPMTNSRALAIAASEENRGMRGGRKSRARKTKAKAKAKKSRKHGGRRH